MPQAKAYKSLKDLVESALGEKIILEDPRTSTPGLGFLLWVKEVYGDKPPKPGRSSSPASSPQHRAGLKLRALYQGRGADGALLYDIARLSYHRREDRRYQAMKFSEGHYLQVEVAGLIANSPEKQLAQKFLAFMEGPGFQDAIPENNWMFPAGKTPHPCLRPSTAGQARQDLPVHTGRSASNRRAWIDECSMPMSK